MKLEDIKNGLYKLKEAAEYYSVDESFLKKRMGKDFIEGIHYFKPNGAKIVRWDLVELGKWFMGLEDEKTKPIIAIFRKVI